MKVAVAMSGGVDSSVAAALLQAQGHDVVGVTLQQWPRGDSDEAARHGGCCSLNAREHAREFALPVANKAESQEICFVPRGQTARYLSERLPVRAGTVVDSSGRELGTHRGTALYTVGQRSGFGDLAEPGPWFVLRIDAPTNRIVVGRREELAARDVALENVTFIDGSAVEPLACQARLRYHTPPIPAVYVGGRLQLGEPFLGAAPGQAAVLYAGSRVLGGGIISAAA